MATSNIAATNKELFISGISPIVQEEATERSNQGEYSDRSVFSKMTRHQYKMPVNKIMDDKIDKRKKEKEDFKKNFHKKMEKLKLKKVSTSTTKE